ncbi:MAG TPA: cell division protein FtsZ [Candidatus Paceibacterota bacterium]|nr:cell division protein FtsZ [Verrucomicrobiota bacterium]HRY48454.1 cell division protein FtsZ [Candidatus Paceibacterota bacterium]HSA03754.1 cell division protein FtsZ [Candidatus Paceibacterota bacterium]
MNSENSAKMGLPLESVQLSVKIFGVGGAGGNAVNYLATAAIPGVTLIAVDADAQALSTSSVPHQLQLGMTDLRGVGASGEPELGWAAAEKDSAALRQHCIGADVVMILTGLGGGTGTGASPVLARVAKEAGALVLVFAILPFECEGIRRRRQAQFGVEQLRIAADGVICFSNQRLYQLLDNRTSAVETYQFANKLLGQAVRCFWQLLVQPALIRIDLSELRDFLKDNSGNSAFATAASQGPNRAAEVVDALLDSPLLEKGRLLRESHAVLISLVGGPDLTMSEVNRVVDLIKRQGEDLEIVLGAAVDPSYADRLEIVAFLLGKSVPNQSGSVQQPVSQDEPSSFAGVASESYSDLNTNVLREPTIRPPARLVPPAPELTQERAENLLRRHNGNPSRSRKLADKLMQGQLPLEIVSKGRFEKSDPTYHKGEDLDLPTFIRKRVPLN